MPGIFSQDQPKTFRCLNCGEIINTAMTKCIFCGEMMDRDAALATAEFQKTLDNACIEARTLKIMALVLVPFYLATWLPVIGNSAIMFFPILFILTPIMLGRWWMLYHRLQLNHDRLKQAQRNVMTAIIVWGLMGGVWLASVLIRTIVLGNRSAN